MFATKVALAQGDLSETLPLARSMMPSAPEASLRMLARRLLEAKLQVLAAEEQALSGEPLVLGRTSISSSRERYRDRLRFRHSQGSRRCYYKSNGLGANRRDLFICPLSTQSGHRSAVRYREA
jgi:hypothetical protein